MLYYNNLRDIVLHHHELLDVDELIILSGYVGPEPIGMLSEVDIKSTVIYGMYGAEKIGKALHDSLCRVKRTLPNTTILYSKIPVHSKCYVWLKEGKVQGALVGSANFSLSGLMNPYKEVLADASRDTFSPLKDYLSIVTNECIDCNDSSIVFKKTKSIVTPQDSLIGRLPLTSAKLKGEVPLKSGLNWGFSDVAHVTKGDAYIPIPAEFIRANEGLIPPKQDHPLLDVISGRRDRNNDIIDLIWDDGTLMQGLLEQNSTIDGVVYPKALSSSPNKNELGLYIRRRMGLPADAIITRADLLRYGRTDVGISKQGDGIYALDFSV